MKQIFKIEGEFEKYLEKVGMNSFNGYIFYNSESKIFVGYIEEERSTVYDNVKFIKGLMYNNKMVFIKESKEECLESILFVFENINEKGKWYMFNSEYHEFAYSLGFAKVSIKETRYTSKIVYDIQYKYKELFDNHLKINKEFKKELLKLNSFLKKC